MPFIDATEEPPTYGRSNDSNSDSQVESVPLSFNISALQKIAEECLHKQCTFITKIDEGSFHKIYLLNMDDGSECIARVACPVFRHLKMKSEVATMKYVAEHTSILLPKIYTWDADPENVVGAEYMLIEKIPGVSLSKVWDDMLIEQKEQVLRQIVDIMVQLFSLTFPKIGSLDHTADGSYVVGPLISRPFIIEERGTMDLDRGPWATTQDYLAAAARREISFLNMHQAAAMATIPEMLQTDIPVICDTFEHLAQLASAFSPKDPELERCALKHTDLLRNLLVDGTRITGVIDWECAGTYPAWSCAEYPSWIIDDSESKDNEDEQEKARLRAFFHAEVASREPLFLGALDEGAQYREFENAALVMWMFYGNLKYWMKELRDNWHRDEPFPLTLSDDDDEVNSSVSRGDTVESGTGAPLEI